MEKSYESPFLFNAEVARPDFGVEVWIRAAAFGVELNHIFKRRQTSVMHIRRRASDLAQSRRLECAVVPRIAGKCKPSCVREAPGAPGDSGIVELLVGKVRTDVARGAGALPRNNCSPTFSNAFSDPVRPAT